MNDRSHPRSLAGLAVAVILAVPPVAMPLVAMPLVARAQVDAGTPPPSTSSPPPSSSRSGAREEDPEEVERIHTQSQTGSGSTATITRTRAAHTRTDSERRLAAPADEDEERLPPHQESDGRAADFIWLEVEGGVSYVNLIALENENFAYDGTPITGPTFAQYEGLGPMVAAGGGFRIFILAIGMRGTYASYLARDGRPGFEIGTFGGEVHLRIPTPVVEPWIRVGAGYAWQASTGYTNFTASSPHVDGWTVNGALGLDIFFTWWLSLGIGGQVDFLNMTRQRDPTAACMGITEFCPEQEGDAIGIQARGFLSLGLHF
jgi:hypothetical protein